MALTREALLKPRFRKKSVKLANIDGEVYVRQLSGMERVEYERSVAADAAEADTEAAKAIRSMARLIVISLVDDKDQLLLRDEDRETIADHWPFEQLEQLFREIMAVNGLSQEALDDAVKN